MSAAATKAAAASLYELRDQLLSAQQAHAVGRADWVQHWEDLAVAVQDVIVDEVGPATPTLVGHGSLTDGRTDLAGGDSDSDLSDCSLGDLETQLRQVDEAIRTVSTPDGSGRHRTRNMAFRDVAILSVQRRRIAAEIRRRRKALAAWRSNQLIVHSPARPDP